MSVVFTAESDPLLSTVLAQNKSFLSVQVTWHLTDHGVFTSAVVSLGLRLINSDEWSDAIGNISLECGRHMFKNLQPGSEYLLNVTLRNKYKQVESRAVVFWSAATNSSGRECLNQTQVIECEMSVNFKRLLERTPYHHQHDHYNHNHHHHYHCHHHRHHHYIIIIITLRHLLLVIVIIIIIISRRSSLTSS